MVYNHFLKSWKFRDSCDVYLSYINLRSIAASMILTDDEKQKSAGIYPLVQIILYPTLSSCSYMTRHNSLFKFKSCVTDVDILVALLLSLCWNLW